MAAKKGSSRMAVTARSSCARASRRSTSLQASGLGAGEAMAAHPPRRRRPRARRPQDRAHCGRRSRIGGAGAASNAASPGDGSRRRRRCYGHRACLPSRQSRIIPCPFASPASPAGPAAQPHAGPPPACPPFLPPAAQGPNAGGCRAVPCMRARHSACVCVCSLSHPPAAQQGWAALVSPASRAAPVRGTFTGRACASSPSGRKTAAPVTLTSRGRRPSIPPAGTACRKRTGVSSFGF